MYCRNRIGHLKQVLFSEVILDLPCYLCGAQREVQKGEEKRPQKEREKAREGAQQEEKTRKEGMGLSVVHVHGSSNGDRHKQETGNNKRLIDRCHYAVDFCHCGVRSQSHPSSIASIRHGVGLIAVSSSLPSRSCCRVGLAAESIS